MLGVRRFPLVLALLLVAGLTVAVQVSVAPAATSATSGIEVAALTTNGRTNPLGIPGEPPSFGWASTASTRSVVQSAYELRVAGSESALASADVWDSGKVESRRQVDVAYDGPALAAQTRYYWQVRVWDGTGEVSAWSEPAWFETGMLSASDWGSAEWVGAPPGNEVDRWTDYTAEFDFTIQNHAFAAFIRAAQPGNGYMWQVSVADGTPRFRPHVRVNGAYQLLDNKSISSVVSVDELLSGQHTMTVQVDGSTITTSIDGEQIDTRTHARHAKGFVGFRSDHANGSFEKFTVLRAEVVAESGETLLDTDFTNGNPFSAGQWGDGGLVFDKPTDALYQSTDAHRPLLRRDFSTEDGKTVTRARVYASARGIYELNINGEKVGDQFLAPGFTDYTDRIQAQTYDVTELVSSGENVFGAELADGWWAGKVGMWGPGVYGTQLSLIARLRIDYSDGSSQWIDTDDTWTTHHGPYAFTDNIDGETYDAQHEQTGWDQPGFDDSGWRPVRVVPSATDLLVPQGDEPVRATEELSVVERTEPTDGAFIYDLGQNMVGVARMELQGEAGDTVRIRYGEELNPDGTLYTANLRAAKVTDYYEFAADGTVTYEPKFTQHGFRYLEIAGIATPPAAEDVTGVVWGSDLPATGALETSSPMLNQLASNISWGQRGNFLSIPTDTPARDERLGWSGDINVFAPTASYLRDTRAFLSKWMSDMADTQFANGDLPGIAPEPPGVGCCGSGTGWSDAGITVPYALWDSYGDASIARQFYPVMTDFMDYLRAHTGPDLIDQGRGGWGDWLHLDDPTPTAVMGTAYLAEDARMMAEMAAALGKDADAAEYAALSEDARAAFANAFIDADGTVSGNSQTGYAMALGMDLVPDDLRDEVGARFVAKLAASDNHLTTGFLGTPWLLPALSSIDRDDLAYTLLMHEDYPSWGYEVAKGATTMWERWNSIMPDGSFGDVSMNSFNHYAYGAVGDWMYENVGGIAADEPGYKRSRIAPKVGGGLTHGAGELKTVYGLLASSWQQTGDGIAMQVTVPVNTTAEVHVPARTRWAVTEGGAPAGDVDGITFLRMEDGVAVFEVGSGDYDFATDRVLGNLGDARAAAGDLEDLVSGLDAPGAEATAARADELAATLDDAWSAYVGDDERAAVAHVHRALGILGDIERWTALQVEKDRVSAADGEAVQALIDEIDAALSAASGRLLGATASVEIPVREWFPGSTVPVTVVVENGGSAPLTSVVASLTAGPGWTVTPEPDPETTVEPGETLRLRYDVAVPEGIAPGAVPLEGNLSYKYRGSTARLPLAATIAVAPPVIVESFTLSPTPVDPGEQLTASVDLVNRADRAIAGQVVVTPPEGWTAPEPAPYSLAAGEAWTLELTLDVPLGVTEGEATVVAAIGATDLEQHTASVQVRIANPPADATDHVDLGNGSSESGHRLTASQHSGTSVEAGLTRRYTHSAFPGGWFEFDVAVPTEGAFVVRAIETFDGATRKTYDVQADGRVVHQQDLKRSAGGHGTITYQFVVDESDLSADGTVRLRFQDTGADSDPSIADVWVVPVG
ncbi:family 78 glycoside hydrolase catalytic domain [Nocardioides bizhenqiangii]|uniref:alpha-L-rhamnosidase n=1 Tax=Nocardioides bizhenqiangii TaxID=3095076 RepID=A0ABZ0ZPU3_9ACTN|nr:MULTISPECIES: family 78 glycoside hydrolase catalytic domain [unclassified Nocardioides]MDZ5619720.1 family 78 glycoside hydrolase catalytic domain [Nocardioides sp. HM23]WQQ26272.1 family 78 glycoside hydrolase catalytic domain [Nocardioides sp. HM61]